MNQTPQQPAPSWPTPPAPAPVEAEALARYDALSREERARVARLVSVTGCTLGQACAAVEATRPA